MEDLELVELLADRGELDRLASHGADREGCAAARVTVELRQDHAVEGDPLLEGGRHVTASWPVIESRTSRTFVRLRLGADPWELVHQRVVDLQPAGGIDDDDVATLRASLLDPDASRLYRVLALGARDGDLELPAELLELRHGRGPLKVGGDEKRRAAVLAQHQRELAGCRRLPRALEADEQDHRRRPPGEREPRVAAAHDPRQLLVDDLHDLLAGREALRHLLAERALLDRCDEVLDDVEVDVGLEQRETDLAHRLGDRLLVERPA